MRHMVSLAMVRAHSFLRAHPNPMPHSLVINVLSIAGEQSAFVSSGADPPLLQRDFALESSHHEAIPCS